MSDQALEEPKQACTVIKDRSHPEASPISGVVPPKEYRYKKGTSGNPRGRALTSAVEQVMEQAPARVMNAANRWLAQVEEGDNQARAQLLDRVEGAVPKEMRGELNITHTVWASDSEEDE